MSISPVNIIIGATATEAIAKFREVNGELEKMEVKSVKAGTAITNLDKASRLASAALAGMALGVAAFGFESVKAAMSAEGSFARMNQALTNAGLGTAANVEAAKKLAEGANKLGFSTRDTAEAYGTLITATHNAKDSQQLLTTAMDLARYKHESLAEASITLSKGTQGSVKAFKELGITLDTSLPKQESINKAFDQLNQKLSGQNAAYLDTFSGKIDVLKSEFNLLQEKVGGALIPILTKLMDFVTKYGKDLLIFTGIVGGVALAIKAWEAATTAYLAVNAYMATALAAQIANEELLAAQAALAGIATADLTAEQIALAAASTAATGPMIALSAAMDANPIGLMVLGVMALVGALLALNKAFHLFGGKSDIISPQQAATDEAKIQANMGYDPSSGTFGHKSSFKSGFDLSNYTGKVPLTAAQKAAAAAAKKAEHAAATANKSELAEVLKLHSELTKANAKYLGDLNAAQNAFNVSQTNAQVTRDDATSAAQKTFNDYMFKENKRYADEKAKLAQANADQITAINKAGADQLAAIVKQSVDLLRNAFAGATKFDVGSIFASNLSSLGSTLSTQIKNGISTVVSWWGTANGSGISGVLTDLAKQLTAAKKLSDDAAKLAGLGYSQTFIQQVVGQGSDIGDQISQSILNASPEQQKSLKDLYAQLDATTNHGVDQLAASMSKPGSLATEALNQQYSDAQNLLTANLAKQKEAYDDASATALTTFNANIGQAEITRDNALANASDAYKDAMNKANQTFSSATAAAQKTITDSLTVIANEFDKKLGSVKSGIASTIAAIAGLKAAIAGSQSLATNTPTALIPFAQQQQSSNNQRNQFVNDYNNSSMGGTLNVTTNVNVDGSTAPSEIAKAVVAAVKYGGLAGAGSVRGN